MIIQILINYIIFLNVTQNQLIFLGQKELFNQCLKKFDVLL